MRTREERRKGIVLTPGMECLADKQNTFYGLQKGVDGREGHVVRSHDVQLHAVCRESLLEFNNSAFANSPLILSELLNTQHTNIFLPLF